MVRLKSDTDGCTRMVVGSVEAAKGTVRMFWMHAGAVTVYHFPRHCLENARPHPAPPTSARTKRSARPLYTRTGLAATGTIPTAGSIHARPWDQMRDSSCPRSARVSIAPGIGATVA